MGLARGTMPVQQGDIVTIEFIGRFDDGTVFDTSYNYEKPVRFEVGSDTVLAKLQHEIIGMEENEKKDFTVLPSQGYGEYNPELVQTVPSQNIPMDGEPKSGMIVGVSTKNGKSIPARIVEVSMGEITLDLNHPFAGKTLHYSVQIRKIEKNNA